MVVFDKKNIFNYKFLLLYYCLEYMSAQSFEVNSIVWAWR